MTRTSQQEEEEEVGRSITVPIYTTLWLFLSNYANVNSNTVYNTQ
jgi:hypothetical protein